MRIFILVFIVSSFVYGDIYLEKPNAKLVKKLEKIDLDIKTSFFNGVRKHSVAREGKGVSITIPHQDFINYAFQYRGNREEMNQKLAMATSQTYQRLFMYVLKNVKTAQDLKNYEQKSYFNTIKSIFTALDQAKEKKNGYYKVSFTISVESFSGEIVKIKDLEGFIVYRRQ